MSEEVGDTVLVGWSGKMTGLCPATLRAAKSSAAIRPTGGLAGVNSGTIVLSYSTATVSDIGDFHGAGGLVGVNTGVIETSLRFWSSRQPPAM